MRETNWEMIQAQNCHFQDSVGNIFLQTGFGGSSTESWMENSLQTESKQ